MTTEEQSPDVEEKPVDRPEEPDAAANEATTDDNVADPDSESSQGEQTQPDEPEPLDFEKLHGNAQLRLRDGSVVTVGQLKKQWGELQEVGKTRAELNAEMHRFSQFANQNAQHINTFAQLAPQAIALLQSQMPEIPPLPAQDLIEKDFFEYQRQVDARARALDARASKEQEIRQYQHAWSIQQERQAAEQRQHTEAFFAEKRADLLKKMPELRDRAKATEFYNTFLKTAADYGFTTEEAGEARDPRLMEMARDAAAYRKLKAEKPKPVNPQQARPTTAPQAPGRRQNAAEQKEERRGELMERARKPGGLSLTEATSLYNQLEKG